MRIFTTGQVAKICEVSQATVVRWFDSGRLKGYRIPGSKYRRIPGTELLRFIKRYGIPLNSLLEDNIFFKILIVSRDEFLIQNLTRELKVERWFKIETARNTFDAGIFCPDYVIIDFSIGQKQALTISKYLRSAKKRNIIIIGILPNNGIRIRTCRQLIDELIDETIRKPFDPALLVCRIRTLAEETKKI